MKNVVGMKKITSMSLERLKKKKKFIHSIPIPSKWLKVKKQLPANVIFTLEQDTYIWI